MAKCRVCGKRFDWIEIPDEETGGLAWRKFEKRKRDERGEPRRPHVCKVKEIKAHAEAERKRPWWLDY